MKDALVSIIIPTYNAEQYIEETISSVLTQTYANIECLVVDDGSPDNSGKRVQEIAKIDSRVLYHRKENGGVSVARNYGMTQAQGEFILFLDSDDLLAPNFICDRVAFLNKNSAYVGCTSDVLLIDEKSNQLNKKQKSVSEHSELLTFKENTQTCPSSYLYRRHFLESNDIIYNPKLFNTADRFFLHTIFNYGKIGYVPDAFMYYRIIDTSMSRKLSPKLVDDYRIYLDGLLRENLLPEKNIAAYKSRFEYTISAYYYHLDKNGKAISYALKSFIHHPVNFIRLLTS